MLFTSTSGDHGPSESYLPTLHLTIPVFPLSDRVCELTKKTQWEPEVNRTLLLSVGVSVHTKKSPLFFMEEVTLFSGLQEIILHFER